MSEKAISSPFFDQRRLSAWLNLQAPEVGDVESVERFAGGQSNPTFALHAAGGRYVLRRKPQGALLRGAHAVEREARVQSALYAAGFPVPRIIATCEDAGVVGSPFYVMALVEGRMFWESSFAAASPSERPLLFDAMNATLARLHAIRPGDVGLGDYGRPDRYVERQIARWSAQYRADGGAGRVPELEALAAWLPTAVPKDEETAIVHGDFRVDNLIFAPDRPEIVAVIDWELSTLGHPIADFAYHLMMYRLLPSFPGGLLGVDISAARLPTEASYVERYSERTGRKGVADLDFYLCYNLFRFAAIIHGIKGRMLRGNASSAEAGRLVEQLPTIARLAHEQGVRAGMPA
ncbi:phosphotransferase family protein [Roseomonas aeriglobus]|nr:phosphotransferase family protein [Roseomonas aeriglobus]